MTKKQFKQADEFVRRNARKSIETLWRIYKADAHHIHGHFEKGWRGFDLYCQDRLGVGYDYVRKLFKAYQKFADVPELADASPARLISLSDANADPEELKQGLTNFAAKSPANAILMARTGRRESRRHKKATYPKNRAAMVALADEIWHSGEVLYRVEQSDAIKFLDSLPEGSVDLVLSDIMYHKKYAPFAEPLAKAVKRVLKRKGQMAIMLGQSTYPYFSEGFRKHLNFRSSLVYEMPSGKSSILENIQWAMDWKPVEVFSKLPSNKNFPVALQVPHSFIRAGEVEKHYMPYQQDIFGFVQIIDRLIWAKEGSPGKTIVDCCCGSGTTLLAGLLASGGPHRVIGCDKDPEMIPLVLARCKLVSELMRKHRNSEQVLAALNEQEKAIAEKTEITRGLERVDREEMELQVRKAAA